MRPVKGLGLLAALTIALGMVAGQPGRVAAYTTPEVAIRNLAAANLGRGPCSATSQGGYFTAHDGRASCTIQNGRPVPTVGWCAIFAAWVWDKSGHVYVTNLGDTPESFHWYGYNQSDGLHYAANKVPPKVGDAVIFAKNGESGWSHVGIVYSVDYTTHLVVTIAGNEGTTQPGTVAKRSFYYTAPTSSSPASPAYHPFEYISARTH